MSHTSLNITGSRPVEFKTLVIESAAFKEGELLPEKFTCAGKNISPPLDIDSIPEESKCLAVIVKDPDAPAGTWIHWVTWNIPVTHHLKENQVEGVEGINSFQKRGYTGPCPPSGKPHRYFFKIYALDDLLQISAGSRCLEVERAMSDHIIAYGEIMCIYQR